MTNVRESLPFLDESAIQASTPYLYLTVPSIRNNRNMILYLYSDNVYLTHQSVDKMSVYADIYWDN